MKQRTSIPRFTLSQNPNMPGMRSAGGDGLYIIHHLHPICIIEVSGTAPAEGHYRQQVSLPDGGTIYLIPDREDALRIMPKAMHWYLSILNKDRNGK